MLQVQLEGSRPPRRQRGVSEVEWQILFNQLAIHPDLLAISKEED